MKPICFPFTYLAIVASLFCMVSADSIAAPTPDNPAATAAPHVGKEADVQNKLARFGGKHFDIVFDGDSITNRWETTGKETWKKRYEGVAADFGIEGDKVENVLWRLNNGQMKGIDPKVVVLMIGTNNSGRDNAMQIADGIKELVTNYETECPHAHIILMGVFPRGETFTDAGRIKNLAVNAKIRSLADKDRVSYVDISSKFLELNRTISKETMPDFVHPTAKCYEMWADAIQPIITKYAPDARPVAPAATPVPAAPAAAGALPALGDGAGRITFSGLSNGINTSVDPEVGQAMIPQEYQPLLNAYPASAKDSAAADGAKLGVTITWGGASCSNPVANSGVKDHTGDAGRAGEGLGGSVLFGTSPYSMTFDQPVQIPSLFWAYYGGGSKSGTISVYSKASDTEPAKVITLTYSEPSGYVWKEETGLAGLSIFKVVFDPGHGDALNIDDITVRLDKK